MFCPKCATQNNEGAKFCRLCGADISLVPQAMTGQIQTTLPDDEDDDRVSRRRRRRGKQPSIEGGLRSLFMGLGFMVVALVLAYSREGSHWWYWMLIPGFMMLGGGLAECLRWRHSRTELLPQNEPKALVIPGRQRVDQLPQRSTSELVAPPPSVTEGTTRLLGAEGPTKVFAPADRPKQ